MKNIVRILLTILLLVTMGGAFVFAAELDEEPIIERAKILEVEEVEEGYKEEVDFFDSTIVKLEILSGDYKGQEFEILHSLSGNLAYDIDVSPGDRVLITIEELDGEVAVYISEYARDTYIYIVLAIFVVLLLLLGGFKGLKTIITLILTIGLIMKVLLPGLLAGYSPILLSIGISIVVTIFTILVVGGNNKKSYAAIIGVLGGVFVAGLIAYFVGTKVRLTGLSSQEAMMLMYIPQGIEFDYSGLLFAGIIMGALGAVMDVGMTIASSMEEIRLANPNMTTQKLIVAGMNVGKDVMGTMANTLILAYTGSMIPLLLLFTAYEDPFTRIINLDLIATEVIRALAGSIGLILCIPLTALVAGLLREKFGDDKVKEEAK
ncbi:YibE/F family protein [Alkaliphilus metalliredigens QYMF]|uniref:YibE/F family protein n=1 Tax=Alkaliphilus metalliredigens (strain QYMF) TaxID=293826 RepID=A6TT73_ALKMQ|nr:YibE/F family protein [Alkaliphilus metalliredigens]ABR49391.1 YibE/F family protein [Alkaliphilus metalliredigens QYMF]